MTLPFLWSSMAGQEGLPKPGSWITPQAGDQSEKIRSFFDASTYRGKMASLDPLGPKETMREWTAENIQKFFDSETYKGKTVSLPPLGPRVTVSGLKRDHVKKLFGANFHHGQKSTMFFHREKRPADAQLPQPAAKMGKSELLEKIRLAAKLNGYELEDLMVSRMHIMLKKTVWYIKRLNRDNFKYFIYIHISVHMIIWCLKKRKMSVILY